MTKEDLEKKAREAAREACPAAIHDGRARCGPCEVAVAAILSIALPLVEENERLRVQLTHAVVADDSACQLCGYTWTHREDCTLSSTDTTDGKEE